MGFVRSECLWQAECCVGLEKEECTGENDAYTLEFEMTAYYSINTYKIYVVSKTREQRMN